MKLASILKAGLHTPAIFLRIELLSNVVNTVEQTDNHMNSHLPFRKKSSNAESFGKLRIV